MNVTTAPEELYDEAGEWIWLRADLHENHGKARYAAWEGSQLASGYGFRDGGVELIELRCRLVYLSPLDEHGQVIGGWADEGTWHRCAKDNPGAVRFYEISEVTLNG